MGQANVWARARKRERVREQDRVTRVVWRAAAALALVVVGCGAGGQDPIAGEEYLKMPADQVMFDVEHHITKDGVRQALLEADTAYLYEDSARVEVRRVHLTLFNEKGEQTAELTSLGGVLNTRTQAMVARGNVVLVTRTRDRRIETQELHYDPPGDRIWSDVATTLTEGGTVVRGTGFTSDGQLRNLQVRQPTGKVEGLRVEF